MRRIALAFVLIGCEAKKDLPPASPSSSPSAPSVSPSMSSCGGEIVGEEGIGQLRIGTNVESLRQKCNVIRDTTVMGAEGMPARKFVVAFSQDTVEAEIVDGRVWRIAISSPGLRTADSIGVATKIGRLRQLKEPHGMTGEGQFFVASPQHCGMSFRLSGGGLRAQRGDLDSTGLAHLPASAAVSEVLVFGCHLGRQ
jgi:hypothetical protein